MHGTEAVPGTGQMTFNWHAQRAPQSIASPPDGGVWERVVELRQNETIDLAAEFPTPEYTWYIFPLNEY
jgi:hypothetical protein